VFELIAFMCFSMLAIVATGPKGLIDDAMRKIGSLHASVTRKLHAMASDRPPVHALLHPAPLSHADNIVISQPGSKKLKILLSRYTSIRYIMFNRSMT